MQWGDYTEETCSNTKTAPTTTTPFTHMWSRIGTYEITCTVSNSEGAVKVITKTVRVKTSGCVLVGDVGTVATGGLQIIDTLCYGGGKKPRKEEQII